MANMAYKGFLWPMNPEILSVDFHREGNFGTDSDGHWVFVGLGPILGTVSGSGTFTGTSAWDSFLEMKTVYEDSTAGILTLPDGSKVSAYFTGLTSRQDAKPLCVEYSFVFSLADADGGLPK